MIRRIFDSRLPLMVYPPARTFDLNFFRAVHEAGGLPVLDTEFFRNTEIMEYIEKLGKAEILFGIRISVSNTELYEWIEKNAPDHLDALIFYSVFTEDMEHFTPMSRSFRIVLEVTDINMKQILDHVAPDAVVLKGFEAGGRVSGYTGYVLMQWYLHHTDYPVFMHGGVGMHNAAGMFSAGVSGVVLDSQLYLSEEAPVSSNFRQLFETVEEFDTVLVEGPSGARFRFFAKLGTTIVHDLKKKESHFALSDQKNDEESQAFFESIQKNTTPLNNNSAKAVQSLFYLGQDAVFARIFTSAGKTVREIIAAFFRMISDHIADIENHDPVKADTELAREHGTEYPIIQGPMANISESADFARKLHEAGGLPFFAMGNLPQHIATSVIENATEAKVPYGAGLIGIEIFNRSLPGHLELVKKYRSPFALFAGGTPFQVADLEKAGTKTYLHTPSTMMLENAIQNGCTRYILEGTEAGGHVGSLGSLVLWELAVERLARMPESEAGGRTLVFAGGISTPSGSHFISGLSSFLARRGVKIALQVGSAYLFTREMIETGSITERYQREILEKKSTLVIGRTVGLPSRTLASPFSLKMLDHEYERISEGMPLTDRKKAFEHDNMGSLLIGAKGFVPDFKNDPSKYICFNEEEVYEKGNFCVGDSLAFFNELTTIREIHETYFCTKDMLARNLDRLEIITRPDHEIHDEIAVTGIGCVFPDAFSPEELWQNVINKKYSIRNVPENRLDPSLYFDNDKHREDTAYSRIGGVIENFSFNGEHFGFQDDQAQKISRSQQLILTAARQAVESACRNGKNLPVNSAVIIASCLGNELTNDLQLKYYTTEIISEIEKLPEYQALDDEAKAALDASLKTGLANNHSNEPPDTAVLNIEASRVAAAFNLEGPNYVVDAACATSFAAIDCAMRELLSGSCDAVVTGGLNTNLSPEAFIGFCKMGALSGEGSYPFDSRANGFVLGEGAGCFVLKRMRDALRDNDEIYGVIKGMGGSSDGKGKAIAAPNPAGQELALRRCFENAKTELKPEDIGYIEAHGTSTIMGDAAEIETIRKVYGSSSVGVSSVKSQIGHLLGGAGSAGLVKAIMALKNKTLPPNGDFRELSSAHDIKNTGIYIIDEAKPWNVQEGKNRKAAVSSYGFGGINYHCVVEEFTENYTAIERKVFPDIGWNPNDDRIVVAGIGAVLPEALDVDEFWERLVEGRSVLSDNPDVRFNMKAYSEEKDKEYRLPEVKAGVVKNFRFNNVKYRIPPMSASSVDRSQLFALTAADQAVSSSGLSRALDFGNRVSVMLGTISGTHYVENVLRVRIPFIQRVIRNTAGIPADAAERISDGLAEILKKRLPRLTEDTTPGLLSNIVSGRIANFFGCNGANFIIDAACASSALAIRAAILNLLSGKSDFVITGGVDTNFYPTAMLVFKRLGLLSEKDTRIFDENGTGVNLSEGAAIQVLTTYKKARELGMPVLAEIRSLEMRSKAGDNMFSPSATLFGKVIEDAHKNAGSSRDEIDHLDVFGFGHYLLDQIEHRAVRTMFRKDTVYGNIKPEFGYFKAANPAVVLTRMILMNMHRTALPFNGFDPETSMTRPDTHSVSQTGSHITAAASMKHLYRRRPVFAADIFGFGGNHGHIVAGAVPAWMQDKQDTVSKITDFEITETSFSHTGKNGLAVLLSGQGAQYRGMLRELYMAEPEIHEMMYRAEGIFKSERGYSLLEMMFEGTGGDINSTENTQPAVFTASAAIYKELEKQGLKADAFIGHSVGEYTALFTSGMLDFETALRLVLKRSALMKKAADDTAGEIMAVFKGSEEVDLLIKNSGIKDVYIANKNSRKQTVVSGAKTGITEFSIVLSTKGILYRKLNLSGAFHTPLFLSAAEGLAEEIRGLTFNMTGHAKVISNVTGRPYPDNPEEIKNLLLAQIVSPVEFIKSVEHLYRAGIMNFVEAGSGKILANLVKDMGFEDITCTATIDSKSGELLSFKNALSEFEDSGFIKSHAKVQDKGNLKYSSLAVSPSASDTGAKVISVIRNSDIKNSADSKKYNEEDFNDFVRENSELVKEKLYSEYINRKRDERLEAYDQFGFYTGSVSIAGVSVGLPGTAKHVFESDNFDRLLSGQNFIESLTDIEKEKMLDKNITRLVKESDGNARFMEISSPDDVIQLAGKLGFFDLEKEYGIADRYDITIGLSIAAGIEALKDAGIPLVMHYRETAAGGMIPEGLALPAEMQSTTGVILTSLFPGWDTLIDEVREYYHQKFFVKPYQEMEKIYYFLMENLSDATIKSKITEWFFGVWNKQAKGNEKYAFKRDFPANITPLGSAHFARIIKAKGPNIQMSGACASTTQAVCVSEDWIRTGRCERVIVIGGEAATSRNQSPWIGSGFLVLGAASTKKSVQEAAKPFDVDRNGTILGAGATSLIVERTDRIKERGLNGQAEILGTRIGNSAFHTTGIDVKHLSQEMAAFIGKVEKRHNLDKSEYAEKMVFMSHETYTPARGGSADAEIEALRASYGKTAKKITITNTKGYTGHTLGAAIEDAVMVKALQTGMVPPVANLKKIPENFADLKFSKGEKNNFEYGLHLSAGFGSHFAFLFVRKTIENALHGNMAYGEWLKKISGTDSPVLKEINKTLCIEGGKARPAAKTSEIEKTMKPLTEPVSERAAALSKPVSITDRIIPKPVLPEVKQGKTADRKEKIRSIIADQTGYSEDMLEDNLDLEADLGIDTVKQVEIFGKITAAFGVEIPENSNLRELNSIEAIARFIGILIHDSGSGENMQVYEPLASKPAHSSGSSAPASSSSGSSKETIRKIIADQTGYSEDMLEYNLDLEADLGIDTVKQVEIFGKITAAFGVEIPEGANLRELNTIEAIAGFMGTLAGTIEPDSSEAGNTGASGAGNIPETLNSSSVSRQNSSRETIRKIISDQTGYSEDMLEYNLDLEADLGIDTVKQVEIFGKITAAFGVEIPEGANLRELNTIEAIADFMGTLLSESSESSNTDSPEINQIHKTQSETKAKIIYSPETAEQIRKIISDQTGYSTEMIGFENDLEADLGIDTIKQVDIFGHIMNHFEIDLSDETDMRSLKSIAEMASFIDTGKKSEKRRSGNRNTGLAMIRTSLLIVPEKGISRFTVKTTETDSPVSCDFDIRNQTLLVSLDNTGLHSHVIPMLKARGANIITTGDHPDAEIKTDFTRPENTASVFEKLSGIRPEISGLVHLYPVSVNNTESGGEYSSDRQPIALFNAVKALCRNPEKPLKLIAMPAFNSVIFPYMNPEITPDAVCAGLSGFLKTVAREMPETRVKVVDFGENRTDANPESVAARFVNEILSEDTRVETGYIGDQKYVPMLKPEKASAGKHILENCDAMLVTGGAGGITFEMVKSIAENGSSIKFILTGRSNLSELDNELENAKQSELLKIFKTRMPGEKPVTIKKAVEKIKRIKKTAENIETLKKLGADVIYYPADVTDISAVQKIAGLHPEINGIIHAAGVEESQAILKKTPESFTRVFDTKVKGFRNISKAFENHDLKFIIAFSSVTARFGNAGQCDYTAANDMLGKLLFAEKASKPELTVKVMAWTAWEGTGMATDETVRKVLTSRGLTFLPPEDGIGFFNAEISNDISGESVFSGWDKSFDPDGLLADGFDYSDENDENNERENYFLDRLIRESKTESVFTRCLDPENDLFLHDHSMAGIPIFLGATGIETMAEAASAVAGNGLELREMSDFAIPYGIKILKKMPKDIEITAEKNGYGHAKCMITSRFASPKGDVSKEHYRGTYTFSDSASNPEFIEIPDLPEISFEGELDSIIYNPSRLFMEGLFKTIEAIEGFDGDTLVTVMSDTSDKPFFTGEHAPDFLTPVVLVDAMFQTGGLFNMMTTNELVLPFGISRMQFPEKPERHEEYLCITKKTGSTRKTDIFDLVLADKTGRVFIRIEGFEMVRIGKLDARQSIAGRFKGQEKKAS